MHFKTYMTQTESASLVVSTATEIVNPADGVVSLREALTYANVLGSAQIITFAPALAGQTITLSSGWTNASDAAGLRVAGNIIIQGRPPRPASRSPCNPGCRNAISSWKPPAA